MQGIRAALLGVRHPHGIAHLRTLQTMPEIEGIYVWDREPEALSEVQQNHGQKVLEVFTDLDALLSKEDLLFVIACLRTDLLPEICLRAINAGKHILAEKPLGRTATEAAPIVKAAEEARVALGVCYVNRYHPALQEAQGIVAGGLLGQLISMELRLLTSQVKFRDPNHWLFRKEYSGGGILAWLGCHYLDLMRFLTREEIVSVSAEVATRSGEEIDVEDVATLALRFTSGAVGSLHVAYSLALSGEGYHNSGYDNYLCINGRDGRLRREGLEGPLQVESTSPSWATAPRRVFDYSIASSPAYGGVYGEDFVRDFLNAALERRQPPVSGRDALQVARIIDAAYESSRTGRRVEIDAPETT
ncbi:MAG: Gfo/Idh/MocA family oxidoreductase [Armatimonadetes bacterium]|nr:Gfo/Idh/MocA family oxidoreductase [Armatimonadota bacterium]